MNAAHWIIHVDQTVIALIQMALSTVNVFSDSQATEPIAPVCGLIFSLSEFFRPN